MVDAQGRECLDSIKAAYPSDRISQLLAVGILEWGEGGTIGGGHGGTTVFFLGTFRKGKISNVCMCVG